jgi:CRP-like cAMP-binding protein
MHSGQESHPIRSAAGKLNLLRNHPIFGKLGPQILDQLSSYVVTKTVKRGKTIFAKGDPGTSLFGVCVGTVKISVSSQARDVVFSIIHEGEIFGEIALLDGRPRTADATAITDCTLIMIHRRDFVPWVRSQPDVALKLIEVLCSRLRHSSEQVEDLMFLDLPGRLAKTLLRLTEGTKSSLHGHRVAITQRELGHMIGMSRESTNKQLRYWEARKWVQLDRGGIVVLAPQELAAIATSGPSMT